MTFLSRLLRSIYYIIFIHSICFAICPSQA